jgi:hypothetical protein
MVRINDEHEIHRFRQVGPVGAGLHGDHVLQPLAHSSFLYILDHRWFDIDGIDLRRGR